MTLSDVANVDSPYWYVTDARVPNHCIFASLLFMSRLSLVPPRSVSKNGGLDGGLNGGLQTIVDARVASRM